MKRFTALIFLAILTSHAYCAPQLISFKEGKLGVNFGGYHAGVGLGGVLADGSAGGLYAEAGTPHGQAARAGLGGVAGNGGTAGGLYAGATAGGNVKASAGLAGGVTEDRAAGTGYASAQAGNRYASSGLGGESSVEGASSFKFSGSNAHGATTGVVKETEVVLQPVQTVEVKPVHKKVHTEFNVEAANEVNPVPLNSVSKTKIQTDLKVKSNVQPTVVVKEVYANPPPVLVEKHIVRTHYKPRRPHYHKTAYFSGYIGNSGVEAPPAPESVVYKSVQPAIEKRIDVGSESAFGGGAGVQGDGVYTKQVTFQRNPTFFADIFNIPISTLKAVSGFLGNAAGSTNISVQKSASVHSGGFVH